MDNSFAQIEVLPNPQDFNRVEPKSRPWYQSQRLLVFIIVFFIRENPPNPRKSALIRGFDLLVIRVNSC